MSATTSNQPRILKHFSICTDPRTRPVQYPLLEIIVTVVLATLCGEEGWESFTDWGNDRLPFLKKLLPFDHGIPSPDTFRRVIERLSPDQFLNSFISWAQELKDRTNGQICIDGKTFRGTLDGKNPLHVVSAWSEQNRIVIGALKTDVKSNEITAIENLLNLLIFKDGDIITIDAIGCQKSIVTKIRLQRADYMIALKMNQQTLAQEVENFFDQVVVSPEYAPCMGCGLWNEERGRKEKTDVWICNELDWLPQLEQWTGLKSIGMVFRRWEEKGIFREEKRYYISSLSCSAEEFAGIVRRHWSIENELHWQLDVTFREDASQISAEANENLRVARMISLELLRKDTSFKRGLKAKMRHCLRSEPYLESLLMQGNF